MDGQRCLSRRQAATYLGISCRTLDRLVAVGDLPCVRIGRKVLLDRADLDGLCERQKAAA